jgi:DNA-binding transcriptional regulator YiaG
MKKKYKSEMLEALHDTVDGLRKIGLITAEEMRYYDDGCLVKPAATVPYVSARKPAASRVDTLPFLVSSEQ